MSVIKNRSTAGDSEGKIAAMLEWLAWKVSQECQRLSEGLNEMTAQVLGNMWFRQRKQQVQRPRGKKTSGVLRNSEEPAEPEQWKEQGECWEIQH